MKTYALDTTHRLRITGPAKRRHLPWVATLVAALASVVWASPAASRVVADFWAYVRTVPLGHLTGAGCAVAIWLTCTCLAGSHGKRSLTSYEDRYQKFLCDGSRQGEIEKVADSDRSLL